MNRPHGILQRFAVTTALVLALAGCGDGPVGPDPDGAPSQPQSAATLSPVPGLPPGHGSGGAAPPSVKWQFVAEVARGWTPEQIDATWGTTTLAKLDGTPFALLKMPYSDDYDVLAQELIDAGACVTCSPNYYVSSPEAEQGTIAFYEGDLTNPDYIDQEALVRVRAREAHVIATGAGTTVAILDTGIDATHPDLAARTLPGGWDFVDQDRSAADETDGIDEDEDGLVDEAAGHGTHVAGIVAAVAPGAALLPVRVLNSDGVGTVYDVASGVRYATRRGADVINLSLGFDGHSPVMEAMIRKAAAEGIVITASAGNAGSYQTAHFPASLPEVICVAALDARDHKPDFSSFGPTVDVSAPGVGIISAYLFQGYAAWSGTSMAAPFVAGAAAVARERAPHLPPAAIRAEIQFGADSMPHAGYPYDGLMGTGRLDLFPVATGTGDGI